MPDFEVVYGNKLISEFMKQKPKRYRQYHKSWDRMIDVIIKFKDTAIKHANHQEEHIQWEDNIQFALTENYDKKAFFPVLVGAIEWLNKIQTKQ